MTTRMNNYDVNTKEKTMATPAIKANKDLIELIKKRKEKAHDGLQKQTMTPVQKCFFFSRKAKVHGKFKLDLIGKEGMCN